MADIDPDVQKALGEEKARRQNDNLDHDFKELVETHAKTKPKEEAKEEDKKLTQEDLEKANDLLSKRLGSKKKEPKKEADETDEEGAGKDAKTEKAEDKKVDAEKKPDGSVSGKDDEEDKAEAEAKKEAKPKVKVSKRPDVDPIDIASAAAARTAEQFMSRKETPEKEPAKGIEDTLTEDERSEYQVFQEMAKDPRFKELPRQYIAFLKKSEEYQRKWETDHPNEEFNPDGSDHDAFYHKNQPKYPDREYKKAGYEIFSRESGNKEIEKLTSEQKKLKAELAVRELEPVIKQTQIGVLGEIIKGMDESILAAIQKENDFGKYADANPVEADIIRSIAQDIEPFIEGLIQIDEDPHGRIDIDKNKASHREWARYLQEKEAELSKRPRSERMTDDGKLIVSRGEYYQLPASSRPGYAFLDARMLLQLRVEEEIDKAKKLYERELKKVEARAKALGWSKVDEKKVEQNGSTQEKKQEKPPEKKEETKSPEAGSSSRVDTSGEGGGMSSDSLLESMNRVLNRR